MVPHISFDHQITTHVQCVSQSSTLHQPPSVSMTLPKENTTPVLTIFDIEDAPFSQNFGSKNHPASNNKVETSRRLILPVTL